MVLSLFKLLPFLMTTNLKYTVNFISLKAMMIEVSNKVLKKEEPSYYNSLTTIVFVYWSKAFARWKEIQRVLTGKK